MNGFFEGKFQRVLQICAPTCPTPPAASTKNIAEDIAEDIAEAGSSWTRATHTTRGIHARVAELIIG
jgi:hypothetical protein